MRKQGGLTVLAIGAYKAKDKPYEVADGGGLYLTVRPNGSKSFNLRYRYGGKPRNLTLGPAALGLAKARELAREALVAIARGHDPAEKKAAAKAAARAPKRAPGDLVESVVADFVAIYAKGPGEEPNTRDWRETQRLLEKHVVGEWQGRRLSEIGRADVHKLLDGIVAGGAPIGANRLFAQLRKLCAWALSRGIVERNPCEGVAKPVSEKGRARERVLDDRELALVWRAADALGWPFEPMIKLLILTGARRDEVAGMSWREVDFEKGVWTIPAARSKNRRAHTVPLAPAAVEILESLPRIGSRDGLIFSTTGATPVSGFSVAKKRLDKAVASLNDGEPLAPWVLHDLRRTAASGMASLRIAPHVVEAVLNHVSGTISGVAAIYNRHDYRAEKQAALEAWARRLEAIVTGESAKNVVELKARAL